MLLFWCFFRQCFFLFVSGFWYFLLLTLRCHTIIAMSFFAWYAVLQDDAHCALDTLWCAAMRFLWLIRCATGGYTLCTRYAVVPCKPICRSKKRLNAKWTAKWNQNDKNKEKKSKMISYCTVPVVVPWGGPLRSGEANSTTMTHGNYTWQWSC